MSPIHITDDPGGTARSCRLNLDHFFEVCADEADHLRLADPRRHGYAITYLEAMRQAHREYGTGGIKTQILYVLSNLQQWRGDRARGFKTYLKSFASEL